MAINLANVVQAYLEDEAFLDSWRAIVARREASIPAFKDVVTRFVVREIDIEEFRIQITKLLHSLDDWGATGTGWLMEINKIPRYHGRTGENGLRDALTGLQASNVGARIEQFARFLQQEKQRLKAQAISGNATAAPGNSAFIISLFAFWLDRPGAPYICYISLRRGVRRLLETGILPHAVGLRPGYDGVEIRTEQDYVAVKDALEAILAIHPELNLQGLTGYWAEAFLVWINENLSRLVEEYSEDINATGTAPTISIVIDHTPLGATPEPLLSQLIARVRSRILVEEDVVRRIYHALLAGHVILTGPPGTGKTELARIIPELLWQTEEGTGSSVDPYGDPIARETTTSSAFATRIVTATDEWSVRTLIGGLAPQSNGRDVFYRVQHGHLTEAVLSNWAVNRDNLSGWTSPERVSVRWPSSLNGRAEHEFRGLWLVIDEFNRAPIDLALGEALTALGGASILRVPVDGGTAELPLPRDFRIIGTLNSFDRNYLNQISEALKRRFAFVEVPPPERKDRAAELAMVLRKSLADIRHLSDAIDGDGDGTIAWKDVIRVEPDTDGFYRISWLLSAEPFREVCQAAWRTFEVIRVYRQLGTAQAIALLRHLLIAGIVDGYITADQWYAALDRALCDTIADQLQVLLPDELDTLIWYSTLDADTFARRYDEQIGRLRGGSERRLVAQLEALAAVTRDDGTLFLTDEEVEQMLKEDTIQIPRSMLTEVFRLDAPTFMLPLFARRLRAYKTDRGL